MADPPDSVQPPPQSCYPTTFLERGVGLPFTTPMLVGSRGRPAAQGGIELIVPNPSGGKGVYVLPWDGVHQLCRPTVHDIRLNGALTALRTVTPATIRQAAHQAAGRETPAAAKAATDKRHAQILVNFLLLQELVQQVEPGSLGETGGTPIRIVELESRATRALTRMAPRLGLRAQEVADGLEELASIFSGIGLPGQVPPPRIIRVLVTLERLRIETEAWAKESAASVEACATLITGAASLTLDCARRSLGEAHASLRDIPALLQEWRLAPLRLAQRIARTEWLLDGWEQICLIWNTAHSDTARHAALTEIRLLAPILPREVCDRVGPAMDIDMVNRIRKSVSLNVDWRTGSIVDRTAVSNGKLRTVAA